MFYGNFDVVVRALTYVLTLGKSGIREAAMNAVLNANYMRVRLKDTFTMAYDEICMHEFVMSLVDLHKVDMLDVLIAAQLADTAAVTAADDEHLGVDGLGDLVGRDGLWLHFPGVLGGLAGFGQRRVGLGGLGLRRASGQAERGHAGGAKGSALEQVATRNSSHVFPP